MELSEYTINQNLGNENEFNIFNRDHSEAKEYMSNEEKIHKVIETINSGLFDSSEIYICSICEKQFETGLGLQRHIVRSHSNEILLYKCDKCGKNFRTQMYCKNHKCANEEDETLNLTTEFFAGILDKDTKESHEKLMKIYSNVQIDPDSFMFHCPFCKLKFKYKNSLKPHFLNNHSIDDPPLVTCVYCGIIFKNNSRLQYHIKSKKCPKKCQIDSGQIHTNKLNTLNNKDQFSIDEELYSCTKCSGIFSSKIAIKEHILGGKCKSNKLKEKIITTKEKYLKTLRILEKAKLKRKQLKDRLLSFGENVLYDSDSNNDEVLDRNLVKYRNENTEQLANKKNIKDTKELISEKNPKIISTDDLKIEIDICPEIFRTEFLSLEQNENYPNCDLQSIEAIDDYSNIDLVKITNNEFVYKIQNDLIDNVNNDIDANLVEVYYNDNELQLNTNITKNDIYLENESEDKEELLHGTTKYDKHILSVDFLEDLTIKNESNISTSDLFIEQCNDEPILEEWIEEETLEFIEQQPIEKQQENIEINETNPITHKDKYNEKFMNFLSLMKKELQESKVDMISDVLNKNQDLQNAAFKEINNQGKPINFIEDNPQGVSNNLVRKSNIKLENEKSCKVSSNLQNQCLLCDKIFRSRRKLETHIRRHTGEKMYKCSHCERSCYDRASLVTHERRHTNDRRYECEHCNEKFFTVFEKKRHQATWHQNGSKRREENIGSLRHIMSYDEKREFGPKALLGNDGYYHCKMCEKICLTAKTMRKHTALHLNGKACPKCSKVFAYESTLKRHLLAPHEEKNFMCTVCGNRYVTTAALKSHSKVHSESAVKCPICPKIFGTIYNFDRHMKHKHKMKNWQETYENIIGTNKNGREENEGKY